MTEASWPVLYGSDKTAGIPKKQKNDQLATVGYGCTGFQVAVGMAVRRSWPSAA